MKNKKIIFMCFICIIFLISFLFVVSNNTNKEVLKSKYININPDNETISLMLETEMGSGEYEQSSSNAWPTSGYVFNETLSKCENGGELTYNETTKKVTLRNNISDRCYVYFDKPLPDVYVATTYNGASGAPKVVGATATLSCTGSDATYNQKYNRVEVSSINGKSTKCTLAYTDRTSKTYLNNKIIGLAGTTQGTGQVVNENGYRYEGKNPNNYIWFNNELWRIIGVFDSTSHGQSGQNLVKIIRDEPLGGLAWDKSNINNWSISGLKKLLNPIEGDSESGAYYNKTNGTGSTYCYGDANVTSNCDYRVKGIDTSFRPMVKNVTWYLGGLSITSSDANYYATTVDKYYQYERDATSKYSSNPANDTGYIGLMYASDYGYSVLASSCARTVNLSSYNTSACAGQSWLYGNGLEWTITPCLSNPSHAFVVKESSVMDCFYAHYGLSARPVLYLDASVYYIDGDGSVSNPYIIGM